MLECIDVMRNTSIHCASIVIFYRIVLKRGYSFVLFPLAVFAIVLQEIEISHKEAVMFAESYVRRKKVSICKVRRRRSRNPSRCWVRGFCFSFLFVGSRWRLLVFFPLGLSRINLDLSCMLHYSIALWDPVSSLLTSLSMFPLRVLSFPRWISNVPWPDMHHQYSAHTPLPFVSPTARMPLGHTSPAATDSASRTAARTRSCQDTQE